jgi:thiamine biosynthesis protein ThiI
MEKIILLKFGELVLKGLNKGHFEKLLLNSVKKAISPYGSFKVYAMQSAGYVEPLDGSADMDSAYEACQKVFGISALSLSAICGKDMDEIYTTAKEFLGGRLSSVKTFKVEAKRSDKLFKYRSPDICMLVGEQLLEAFDNLSVDVHNPDITVTVEIRDKYACIHELAEKGAGGMPTGSNGKGMLLISGGIDSPVAGYMMAKRGMALGGVHFFSHPYTSDRAKEKVFTLLLKLKAYCGPIKLSIVPFTEIQEAIRAGCNEEYFTLVMRTFMMKIADAVAQKEYCGALITGESLGQVASQTLEAIGVTDKYSELPVLRPVVGLDKEEIISIARKIDTFETSILPYEDCCTVFTPKHPKTKPRAEAVAQELSKLDVDALMERALAGIEIMMID